MTRYTAQTKSKDGGEAVEPTGDAVLPGIDPGEILQPSPERLEAGIPYVSKSRIKTFVQCPAKFYWKYWCEHSTPGSIHTEKGWRLHDTFEQFHVNLMAYIEEHGERPDRFHELLPTWKHWSQWLEQFGAFIMFEERRWDTASDHVLDKYGEIFTESDADAAKQQALELWEPVEVEAEAWLGEPPAEWFDNDHVDADPDYVAGEPPVGDAPWMGRADLIVHTESVPGVEGSGVVIVDYKTGSCPTIRYDGHPMLEQIVNEGIFLEGEYYGWLFELNPEFDHEIDAVAGYYPQEDEFVVSPYPNQDRKFDIKKAVLGMQKQPELVKGNGPPENFDYEEQPLCNYSGGNCHFYNICGSTYGQ